MIGDLEMMDISSIMFILAFLFLIIAILFTVFLVFNEYKLRRTRSLENLKRMYKEATYLSISFLVIGLIFMSLGVICGEDASAYMGWSLISASIIALVYSIMNLHSANKAISKSEKHSSKNN